MTTIKATCPMCGEVELTATEVRLVVCSVDTMSYYAFDCPGCVDEIRKPADPRIVALLLTGGVQATQWTIPAEALETKFGPALSYDDLLDFALLLQDTGDLVAAAIDTAISEPAA